MWTVLLVIVCLWTLAASAPLWSPEQVGDYFNGIFRSVVGPLFGLDDGNNNTTPPSN
ncbi:uncharacterized protein LOC133845929 [Drosophila sulfurigaster albostrigata]|uniref:Uncharacterized protein LOC117571084 n=1 Tax=Drosophila albomicans TaxID=7291 RepID=A0A6P8YT58_DROAB|nr:uncharacterized protein LOC117571084 [Drosophila albomicans]XP_062136571.1 uncharacterized protein LOC133845929 [Drosophila sulfurigaster albostrigata]